MHFILNDIYFSFILNHSPIQMQFSLWHSYHVHRHAWTAQFSQIRLVVSRSWWEDLQTNTFCLVSKMLRLSTYAAIPVLSCKGIMAGSPCPPEVVKKLITVMDMKEMMVSWMFWSLGSKVKKMHSYQLCSCIHAHALFMFLLFSSLIDWLWNYREQPCDIPRLPTWQWETQDRDSGLHYAPYWGML